MNQLKALTLTFGGLLLAGFGDLASATTLNVSGTGWYGSTGGSYSGNTNFFAGQIAGSPASEYSDYFSFDLSGLTGPVTTATLIIVNRQSNSLPATSTNSSDTFTVSAPGATAAQLMSGTASFASLTSATQYGSFTTNFNTLGDGTVETITLDAAALAAINSDIGTSTMFAMGGSVTSASGNGNDYLFVGENGGATPQLPTDVQLLVNTPEPGTMGLLGSGLVAAGLLFRRRSGRAK